MMNTGAATAHFTSQELYLIRLLAAGYENAVIANFLNLSVSRVKSLITEVYTKLGVQNGREAGGILPRFSAIQKAKLLGLLSEDLPGQASSSRP